MCENHPTTSRNSDSEADTLVNHLNERSEIPNRCKLHFSSSQTFVFLPYFELRSLFKTHTSYTNLFYFKQDSEVELEIFLQITYFPGEN
jgi:hypothetical protein